MNQQWTQWNTYKTEVISFLTAILQIIPYQTNVLHGYKESYTFRNNFIKSQPFHINNNLIFHIIKIKSSRLNWKQREMKEWVYFRR
jgi:hypothetical protein